MIRWFRACLALALAWLSAKVSPKAIHAPEKQPAEDEEDRGAPYPPVVLTNESRQMLADGATKPKAKLPPPVDIGVGSIRDRMIRARARQEMGR
jgi:hypothetical protein